MWLRRLAIVGFVIVAAVAPAMAGGDVNSSGELGLFTLRSGHTYNNGEWGFSLYGNEWDWRVPSDEFWEDFDPLWSNWDMRHRRASAGFGFGLTDRFELDVMLPYEWYKAGHVEGPYMSVGHLFGNTYVGEIDQSGWGDIRIGAAFGLTDNDSSALALRGFIDARHRRRRRGCRDRRARLGSGPGLERRQLDGQRRLSRPRRSRRHSPS